MSNQLGTEGRLVAIMLDRSIMSGPQAVAARNIALAAIDQLGPSDLAAVIRNDGFANDGAVQGFTRDKARLRAAAS